MHVRAFEADNTPIVPRLKGWEYTTLSIREDETRRRAYPESQEGLGNVSKIPPTNGQMSCVEH